MTLFVPAPTQFDVQTALRAFLLAALPVGVEVFEGQDNRISEPTATSFVVMTTILRQRLETNTDTYADCAFTASIAGTTMTVTAIKLGALTVGNALFGTNVVDGSTIVSQTSGPADGTGVYVIAPTQTVTLETMACGIELIAQPTRVVVQLDVHASDVAAAADLAQTISTLVRDGYAGLWYSRNGWTIQGMEPLYAEDPRQVPFLNAEKQYETRYVVDVSIQANQVIKTPMQFADQLTPTLTVVQVDFPIP